MYTSLIYIYPNLPTKSSALRDIPPCHTGVTPCITITTEEAPQTAVEVT